MAGGSGGNAGADRGGVGVGRTDSPNSLARLGEDDSLKPLCVDCDMDRFLYHPSCLVKHCGRFILLLFAQTLSGAKQLVR